MADEAKNIVATPELIALIQSGKAAKDYTVEEAKLFNNFFKTGTKELRAEKKLEKSVAVKKDRPELALLIEAFKPILDANMEEIAKLFNETVSTEKPKGQKGINLSIAGSDFNLQILNKAAFEHEAEVKKAEKKAADEKAAAEKA